MDIAQVIFEDDLEVATREARQFRNRVAVAHVAVEALIEQYEGEIVDDLKRLRDVLEGRLVDVNAFGTQEA